MTDSMLIILVILPAWLAAILLMRVPQEKIIKRLREIEKEENEVYDPSQDPEKIMKGETESYFD